MDRSKFETDQNEKGSKVTTALVIAALLILVIIELSVA